MDGNEAMALMSPEARATSDETRDESYIRVKLNIFDIAFHNLEASAIPTDGILAETRFHWMPFPCGAFVDLLLEAFAIQKGDRTKKFLEVGAGIGSKVALASVLFDSYGIEIDKELWEKSKVLGVNNRIGVGDAMLFDDYKTFDMIYYFRPICNQNLYTKLEEKIHQSITPGTLVAPIYSVYDWKQQPDIEQVSRFWFRKKMAV